MKKQNLKTPWFRHVFVVTLLIYGCTVLAQNEPEQDRVRFNRFATKNIETLALKAGGPTERIEIQSTNDHIDYVLKTYVLKEANASEVFELIQLAIALEGGAVSRISPGSMVEINQNELSCKTSYEGDSILVVTAPKWMIPYLDESIAALDRADLEASAFGTGGVYVKIKHRLPSEVADLIAETAASPFSIIVPDDSRQILYLEDTPSYFGCDLESLEIFDVPSPQIETRVRIYEIDEEYSHDVGLDWYAWKKSIDGGGLTFVWDNLPKAGSYGLNLQSLTAELSFTPQLVTEFLNYLVNDGKAKVVTDSRLTQINGKSAIIRSTTNIPFVVRRFINGSVSDSPVVDSPTSFDVDGVIKEFVEGVVVEMTPRIGADIELAVSAKISSHVGYTPNQSVPILTESSVDSVVLLKPGNTAVIGGLTRKSTITERSGLPVAKSLPGLKYLFSREIQRTHTSQIIITISLERREAGDDQSSDIDVLPLMNEM